MAMDPQEIGRRIKQAREAQLWTQIEFARKASVSPSSVARWEGGKLPPVRELVRIADVLSVEPEWLVERPTLDATAAPVDQALGRLERQAAETRRILELVAGALGIEVPGESTPPPAAARARSGS